MILSPWVQLRHRCGGYLTRIGPFFDVESWAIVDDARQGGFMEREDAEHFVGKRQAPIAWDEFSIVPAVACACCGKWASYGGHPSVPEFQEVAPGHWRCDKHRGRNPCCIKGCGRTFGHEKNGYGYDTTVVCGAHWRRVPLRIRRHCKAIRRKAKRFGWTDRLNSLYDRAWFRGIRAIQHGHRLDMTEIDRMFGWDQPNRKD